jgi:hypothetical protein
MAGAGTTIELKRGPSSGQLRRQAEPRVKAETLNIIIRGQNLESLRRALAKGTVQCLQVFDKQRLADAPYGEAVIESITLRQE